MNDDELFYIVGVGRSGTTLLMSMLNAHPEIGTPPETHFVTEHVLGRRWMRLVECRERLGVDRRLARLGLDLDEVFRSLEVRGGRVSTAELYRRILGIWKERHGVRLVGDKAPRYVEFLPLLKSIAPGARVIHLIRDPRAVFLSRTKAAWSANRSRWSHMLAYTVQYAEGRVQGPDTFGARYEEVLYERLISDPERELGRLCQFLGVEFAPSMLQFSESASEIISADEWSWKREAAGPLLTENAEKWRGELSRRDVAAVETACRAPFLDGLYVESGDRAAPLDRIGALGVRGAALLYRAYLRRRFPAS